jgi:uncharacterized damage-inducible protein DinB
MLPPGIRPTRRTFLTAATALTATTLLRAAEQISAQTPPAAVLPNVFGPRPGYTPQIGTFISQLTWMQGAVTRAVPGLTVQQLDWLFDKNANSIGALLLHLAATETYYQMNTFGGMEWDSWSPDIKKRWDPAMNLGDAGRATIKGHELKFYLDNLAEVRAKSLAEFKKRDDAWFLAVDQTWPWGPTNNFCKWFHVCEHESHHAGQIDLLIKRTPGYKQA